MRLPTRLAISGIQSICVAALLCLVAFVRVEASETITATATVTTRSGVTSTAPLTVIIDRFSTDSDRDEILAAIKSGGTDAVRNLLLPRGPIGSVIVGTAATSIKYAYERVTPEGRLITVVTATPMAYVGGSVPGAPVKYGLYVGLVMLEVKTAGAGHGELAPATKIRLDAQGAIVTEDYSDDVVQLSNVVGK